MKSPAQKIYSRHNSFVIDSEDGCTDGARRENDPRISLRINEEIVDEKQYYSPQVIYTPKK